MTEIPSQDGGREGGGRAAESNRKPGPALPGTPAERQRFSSMGPNIQG